MYGSNQSNVSATLRMHSRWYV